MYINNFYLNGLPLILPFQASTIFSQKSCVTVSYNGKSTILVLYQQSLPLFRMDIRALPLRSAAPPSGGSPPPPSDGGRDLGLYSGYMIICVNVSMCTQIGGQYHLTIQVKISCPTGWVVSRNLWPYAAWMLSPLSYCWPQCWLLLLAHIPPLSWCNVVNILTQDCFGQFRYLATTISLLCSNYGALSIPLSCIILIPIIWFSLLPLSG